jgi:YbgC/YbaW family acyl-CoA thioester hydrolase
MSHLVYTGTARIRWADVDLVGIMRFSAVTRFIEMAEQELLREAGLPFGDLFSPPAVWMPRRHLSIDYLAPARIDDALTVRAWVSRMGDTSLTLAVELAQPDGRLVARTALVVVCVTVESFEKRPLPHVVREKLAPYLEPAASPGPV